MNIKDNLIDTIIISYTGWRFFLNLTISWIILQLVKSILSSNGIIFGGLLATIFLFIGIWIIGLPYALSHPINKKDVVRQNIKQKTMIEIFKENKVLKYFSIFTAILFITMVTLVSFFSK